MQLQPHVWQALALNGTLVGALVVALAALPLETAARPPQRTQLAATALFALAAMLSLQPAVRVEGMPAAGHLDAVIGATAAFTFGLLPGAATLAAAALWRVAADVPQLAHGLLLLGLGGGLGLGWRWLRRRFALGPWRAFTGLALCIPLVAWLGAEKTWPALLTVSAVAGGCTFVLAGLIELVLGRARARGRLHRLNRKLLQREQELTRVLEAAGGGRWEWNFIANKSLFRGTFYEDFDFADPGRVTTWKDWRALWHPDDVARLDAQILRNQASQLTDFDAEFRVRDRNGRWRWLLTRGRVIERGPEGQPLRMVGMHHDITAHREIEEALRSSQAKFATMYQTMPDAAGITSIANGRYLEINPAFCQLLGYTRDEVIGKTSGELRVWETEEERRKLVDEFMRRGQVDALELKVRHHDGHIIPGQMSARRMLVGEEECFFFLFHETSAQKRVEAELRGANALLQHAGRLATLGVWEVSPEKGKHYWSPVVYDIHGLPQGTPVPDDYVDRFVLPPYRAGLRQAFSDCVRQRQTWNYEMEIRRTDGEAIWVRVRGEPVVDDGDRVAQMRGVVQDIDESRRNLERLRQSEDLFSRMFQLMPDPLGISRQRNGHLIEVNPAWEKTLGYARAEAIGRSVVELGILDPGERETMVRRASVTGELLSWEVRLTTRSGEQRIGLQSMRTIDIEGEPCWLFVVRDITERRRAEALVREREELLSLTIEAASLGLWDWNLAQGEISGDARWREHRGLTEARAYRIDELRHTTLPEDPEMIRAAVQHHTAHPEQPFDVVRRVLLPGGASRWVRNLGKIVARDADGQPLRMVGVDIDVTQQREQQALLEQRAHYDALTGLPNRVLLADRLQQAMAQAERAGKLLGVAYLDLDSFKPVNDRFGHDAGDRLLVEIAQRLQHALRAVDSVARLGGDEFVLLMADLESVQAAELALQRVMASVAAPYLIHGERVTVTASIGTTLFPLDRSDPDTLLRHADQAMYAAKQAGRNRVQIFDSAQEQAARDRQQRLQRLREALARDEFVLHMQPKVHMREGRVVGAEALARWQHPDEGLLPPARFLPLIEGSDLDIAFGEWVVRSALAQLDAWCAAGQHLPLSINISARHLQSESFAATLAQQLMRHPTVAAGLLEIEITETAALTDLDAAIEVLGQLRQLGVSVALDDFGTGYSSLTYLRRLPVDTLKIDRSFVHGAMSDQGDLAIVQGIVGLAQSFGRAVVAEGVETPEQGVLLLRAGCVLAQGYGIAAPMPAAALAGWSAQWQPPHAWRETTTAGAQRVA